MNRRIEEKQTDRWVGKEKHNALHKAVMDEYHALMDSQEDGGNGSCGKNVHDTSL
jgi:hypothetical protein